MLRRIPGGADMEMTKKSVNSLLGDIELIIASNITKATEALNAAVQKLEKLINAEGESRSAADGELRAALKAESQLRAAIDGELQNQMKALAERMESLESDTDAEED